MRNKGQYVHDTCAAVNKKACLRPKQYSSNSKEMKQIVFKGEKLG